jgi:hypothetical protein
LKKPEISDDPLKDLPDKKDLYIKILQELEQAVK